MDHKTILITALFVLCVLLFAGLPEDGVNAAASTGQTTTLSGHAPSVQPPDLVKEVAGLREERVRLYRELNLLRIKLQNQSAIIKKAESYGGSCSDQEDNQEPSGVTVYLETSPADPNDKGVQWTAVNFRDAGISPDGSKQAVLRISRTAGQIREPTSGYRNQRENWQ